MARWETGASVGEPRQQGFRVWRVPGHCPFVQRHAFARIGGSGAGRDRDYAGAAKGAPGGSGNRAGNRTIPPAGRGCLGATCYACREHQDPFCGPSAKIHAGVHARFQVHAQAPDAKVPEAQSLPSASWSRLQHRTRTAATPAGHPGEAPSAPPTGGTGTDALPSTFTTTPIPGESHLRILPSRSPRATIPASPESFCPTASFSGSSSHLSTTNEESFPRRRTFQFPAG